MNTVRKVTDDIYWIGANDQRLHLFENIHPIPKGVSYNSYVLLDEKTVLFDSVEWSKCREFLDNLEYALDGRDLDYMVINHMEPDHAASIEEILIRYPNAQVISTEKAFMLMHQFKFPVDGRDIVVKEGDTMSFGKHTIAFVEAPMVHWPETMVSFDVTTGALFAADAFGSFGALNGKLFNDEVDFDRDWLDEARRYYTNIVGKYGPFVQAVLKKAATLDIKYILPLHGPVWRSDFGYILDKYDKWSSYTPEDEAVIIVYASMYGNTEYTAQTIASMLSERGVDVRVYDVSNHHVSELIAETFRVSHVVLCSCTYNLGIYPYMHNYLMDMKALNVQNRTFAIVENGSWSPKAGDLMTEFINEELKLCDVLNERLTVTSALGEMNERDLTDLVDAIVDSVNGKR